MFLIKVDTKEKLLFYKVNSYKIENGRCTFLDEKTNTRKNFPHEICYIEELVE